MLYVTAPGASLGDGHVRYIKSHNYIAPPSFPYYPSLQVCRKHACTYLSHLCLTLWLRKRHDFLFFWTSVRYAFSEVFRDCLRSVYVLMYMYECLDYENQIHLVYAFKRWLDFCSTSFILTSVRYAVSEVFKNCLRSVYVLMYMYECLHVCRLLTLV